MPVYSYNGKDSQGNDKNGTIDAPTEKVALMALSAENVTVTSLMLTEKQLTIESILKRFSKIPLSVKVDFTRQLSTMINAGLPLAQSLEVLEEQTSNARMKEVVGELVGDIRGGSSFSKALERHPNIFPNVFISLVKAGEASGGLDKTLLRLAETMERQRDFQSKTKGAMVYPIVIMVAMAGVFALMMLFVMPKLSDMYENMGAELPMITKVLMGTSDFFVKRWYLLILAIVGAFLGFRKYKKTDVGKHQLARITFKLPIVGVISKQTQLAEFTRTLGLLASSGVPILESLTIAAESMTNVIYQEGIASAAERVRKGEPLSIPLKENAYFPPLVSQMVSVGEQTGKVDEVLMKLSAYYESESEMSIKNLSTAIEPIIMIALGGMVALLMLSVITPIYNLTSQF
ncbi:hypothetical protein COT51_02455 [candidate division WWE3 bacterium CG08_land_8_20_14_0_20_41_15]|uniref:Type II secretion system protein GspF domain-containing protein n=1 Tax=candidate division WWE3 bacterium CG08_land_8_20_14_0_20_41_15 TaxID=1975086 RepID=A0A2H0X972_UNCKA|nr:MAG: hypothetical protein COT51_02455 [candidate division WWE3 bacterium CG08_land_8_20_14_0_20_41_15]